MTKREYSLSSARYRLPFSTSSFNATGRHVDIAALAARPQALELPVGLGLLPRPVLEAVEEGPEKTDGVMAPFDTQQTASPRFGLALSRMVRMLLLCHATRLEKLAFQRRLYAAMEKSRQRNKR